MTEQPHFRAGPVSSAIFRVARIHKALAGQLLRDSGLQPGQELVLMTLWQRGPQRQVDLAQTLDANAPTITRSIARLEKAGLVRSTRSTTDRRAVIVEATTASHALRTAVERAWAELERATVGALSPTEVTATLHTLARLEANLAGRAAPARPGQ